MWELCKCNSHFLEYDACFLHGESHFSTTWSAITEKGYLNLDFQCRKWTAFSSLQLRTTKLMASCPAPQWKLNISAWPVSLISALLTLISQQHSGELVTVCKVNSPLINARKKREAYTHLCLYFLIFGTWDLSESLSEAQQESKLESNFGSQVWWSRGLTQ